MVVTTRVRPLTDVLDSFIGHIWNTEAGNESGDMVDGGSLWAINNHNLRGETGGSVFYIDTETLNTSSDQADGLFAGTTFPPMISSSMGLLAVLDLLRLYGRESSQGYKSSHSIDSDSFLRNFHRLYIFLLETSDQRK